MRVLAVVALVVGTACAGAPPVTVASPASTVARSASPSAATPSGTPVPTIRTPDPATCPLTAAEAPATKAFIDLEKGGTIVIQLVPDEAPKSVASFAKISRSHCYDGLTFHVVVPGVAIQGGDPAGDGTGGGQQPREINDLPFTAGSVGLATANGTPNNSLYQFFILLRPDITFNERYTKFGNVVQGFDVAQGVMKGDKIKTIRIE